MYRGPCESSDGKGLLWMPSVVLLTAVGLASLWIMIQRIRGKVRNDSRRKPKDLDCCIPSRLRHRLVVLGKHRGVFIVKSKIAISAYQIVKQA